MGVTKSEIFTDYQNELAVASRVFGHPARIAILQHLIKTQTCVCGDLVEVIGLAQPTISQHLKELKNLGLIKGNIEGARVCYCIDAVRWGEIKKLFESFLGQQVSASEECC
ncbi:metalloregulator ArsR/SmtB family transcription factor [Zunongwangia sp. F363]|uniref:Metalloregulator ArsR/SmtB family transcription factor n=1 Tax=Autumnicola tepida TaxID=3075595 RepID=A0ABU3CAF2_9FLAO|nr:metalloregulator ArsR/SmtB family transcription factor [Zunongwangia sp. F363]MDT0643323.1 metalloregulator ArsR/SmtB family transcription factor [Zunongwangia sp. F363]